MGKHAQGRPAKRQGMWFPDLLYDDPVYIQLSLKAKALLLDMGRQFNGHNNGNLKLNSTYMAKYRGFKKSTVERARDELLTAKLLEITYQGGLNIGASCYGFTWLPINECKSNIHIREAKTPSRPLRKLNSLTSG